MQCSVSFIILQKEYKYKNKRKLVIIIIIIKVEKQVNNTGLINKCWYGMFVTCGI